MVELTGVHPRIPVTTYTNLHIASTIGTNEFFIKALLFTKWYKQTTYKRNYNDVYTVTTRVPSVNISDVRR